MIRTFSLKAILFIICVTLLCGGDIYAETADSNSNDDGYRLWLKYDKISDANRLEEYRSVVSAVSVRGESQTCDIIRNELKIALGGLLDKDIPFTDSIKDSCLIIGTPANCKEIKKLCKTLSLKTIGNEGFVIKSTKLKGKDAIIVAANKDIGLLYGTFAFLRLLQRQQSIQNLDIVSQPKIQYRLLNHWDNLDGTVERGYAGRSLWKWDELPGTIDRRYYDYARANASIGINGTVLNNVNANPDLLKPEYLKKVAALADVFRPYGIKVYLSVNFSSPISAKFKLESSRRGGIGNLQTSDPMDPNVRRWWKDKAAEIYKLIPDFGGFLVKSSSEGMPGPQEYNRTHVDGANMLAEALAPHGGIVMWRSFVYNAEIDPDRAKRNYKEFVPLDGKFAKNVFVQSKNGPIDFQPREPVAPIFGAMPKTPSMLELQITQEYLGHSKHLVYLAPMWKEYLEFDTYSNGQGSTLAKIIDGTLQGQEMTGMAGVSNIGNNRNWTGHLFAQANWYAFGRLSWDHSLSAEEIADEWVRATLTNNDEAVGTIKSMMLGSWEACVNYMTPLGLHHIMQEGFHYGPEPQLDTAAREDWNSVYYHRADANGLGFDRTCGGSGAVSQYSGPVCERFNDVNACPEKYLLWFHHVPWDRKMQSERTLWNELCLRYNAGAQYVDKMISDWQSVEKYIKPELYEHVAKKLQTQKKDAGIWRDTCIGYFQKFNKRLIPDFK
ncbi:MAG: alpha-glucuronidase family glycosyl hydrolase [Phycisphaerae bacterium]|jgi:alpha-glucuronidase